MTPTPRLTPRHGRPPAIGREATTQLDGPSSPSFPADLRQAPGAPQAPALWKPVAHRSCIGRSSSPHRRGGGTDERQPLKWWGSCPAPPRPCPPPCLCPVTPLPPISQCIECNAAGWSCGLRGGVSTPSLLGAHPSGIPKPTIPGGGIVERNCRSANAKICQLAP